jgi:ATP-dependent protease ClpP protease subunit
MSEFENEMPPELVAAKIANLNAETDKLEVERAKALLDLRVTELLALKAEESWAKVLADDEHNHVYRYSGAVGQSGVKECINTLTTWSRLDGDDPKPITVEFYSPGGDVVAGLALFDCLRDLSRKGHHIITRATGYAASMAGILLQAGDERIMSPESWLLIHEGGAGVSGDMGKIEDTVDWFRKIDERILNIFYERSRGAEKEMTKAALRKAFDRKDWWLDAEQALAFGFCDRID